MTATITQIANKPQTPMSRDEVKRMLRDAAFVLQMTERSAGFASTHAICR